MSNFTSSIVRQIPTWLDSIGIELSHPRYDDENLFEYKNRLIDVTKNPPNSTINGLNNAFGRALKVEKTHVLTIEPREEATKPYIVITSKYIKLYNNSILVLEENLEEHTINSLYLTINNNEYFYCTYIDEDFEQKKAIKLAYGSNLNHNNEVITEYGYKLLNHKFINDYLISSPKHTNLVTDHTLVTDINDFYIDKNIGAVYFHTNGVGRISYSYYKFPYKLYYMPIRFYPLSDEDTDKILYDQHIDTEEYKVLNSTGANIINEILKNSPITWGE